MTVMTVFSITVRYRKYRHYRHNRHGKVEQEALKLPAEKEKYGIKGTGKLQIRHLILKRYQGAGQEEIMKKHIMGENGISYTLGADGMYYPNLRLPDGQDYEIGRYGRMWLEYLKNYHRGSYMGLLTSGKLNQYLHECEEECCARMEFLTEQMKAGAGITEELKADDQMKWVGLMNNVRSSAEEIVRKELIYC